MAIWTVLKWQYCGLKVVTLANHFFPHLRFQCIIAPGYGFYFVTYDLIRNKIAKTTGRDEHGFVPSFLAGGAAGCVIWSSTFPFDTIKTRIQTAPFDTPKAKLRIPTVARTIVKEEGFTALYRGLSVSLVRAFPVNAIVFPVYGFVLRRLQENAKA